MKKVKIMLLSLALFAVVGGALAFKAKFNRTWCVTNAYSAIVGGATIYYCDFVQPNGIRTTTTCGGVSIGNVTTDPAVFAVKIRCTTLTDPNGPPFCDKLCGGLTSTKID